MHNVRKAKEAGWDIGYFKDKRPEGLILQDPNGLMETVDGESVSYDDTIELGIYRMCKDPFKKLRIR